MRPDAVGMFWEDVSAGRGKRSDIVRPMAPIPETGWLPPTEYPNLSGATCIALDTETYDPELLDNGPGWARGKGHIVGASVAVAGGHSWYFPIRHTVESEYNLDPDHTLAWLRDTLGNSRQAKLGANLTYDVGWLRQEGVHVKGQLIDTCFAEALLDESAEVNLDTLGVKYLGEGKETNLLYQWCSDSYGGKPNDGQRANIYRSPPRLVGPYAQGDADLPLRVAAKQYQQLVKENLYELFQLECRLIPLLIEMRFAGVTVDIPKAEQLRDTLQAEEIETQKRLNTLAGMTIEVTKSATIALAFQRHGISIPQKFDRKTKTMKPSFDKASLEAIHHPMIEPLLRVKLINKLRTTFVESYVLDSHVGGKLYGQFHPLRGDSEGTRSGRFSSTTPNLQNLPARDDILAPLMRGIFIPDSGHKQWDKFDYSQIEYRFLAHFAQGPKSDWLRSVYVADPKADFHETTLDLVAPVAGWDISTKELRKRHRKPTKNINFGLVYGMGERKLGGDLGLTPKETKELFKGYHQAAPFVKATMDAAMDEVKQYGTVTTVLGRKSRFDLWEPERTDHDKVYKALPYQQALFLYGQIKRAYGHKGLNRKLQGSAADLIKTAMVKCWEDGIFDMTGVPRLQVHDELDFSNPGNVEEAYQEMQHIMETALPLKVPVKVERESGPDWGHHF